jgi:hypothetical protein
VSGLARLLNFFQRKPTSAHRKKRALTVDFLLRGLAKNELWRTEQIGWKTFIWQVASSLFVRQ